MPKLWSTKIACNIAMLARPARVLTSRCFGAPLPTIHADSCISSRTHLRVGITRRSSMADERGGGEEEAVSQREWQGWGTSSPLPTMVAEVIDDMRALERDFDAKMSFGGLGGKLKEHRIFGPEARSECARSSGCISTMLPDLLLGNFKVQEDKKHRALYQSLTDSEMKLQFFSARQVACRLLGSRGYLCQKCWLPMEDCLCSKLVACSLWHGIRFWLYMHPKDFLRQNNTGKLLWQIFGVQAASICLFGIREHEEIMWDTFRHSGKSMVCFLYPNKNAYSKSVQDILDMSFTSPEGQSLGEKPLHFVLIDGTWSNSAAMYRRLKEKWMSIWGDEDLPCVSLSTTGASVMHKLRPQPSWDRTCTAAAAAGLLSELGLHPQLGSHELDKQAEAVENGLDVLLEALTFRRLRMGRSITRKERNNCCM